jgi:hypothetical protein
MAKARSDDPKSQALTRDGVLNPHPEAVRDSLFTGNPFFDPRDLLQVRYEMVRRHQADGIPISDVAASFGVSRPTFYKAQSTVAAGRARRPVATAARTERRPQNLARGCRLHRRAQSCNPRAHNRRRTCGYRDALRRQGSPAQPGTCAGTQKKLLGPA